MRHNTRSINTSVSLAKEWDELFSRDRNFKEQRSYVEWKRSVNAEGDELDIFLRETEDSIPLCSVEEVKAFCRGVRLSDLTSGSQTAARRAAWLDDRKRAHQARKGFFNQLYPFMETGAYGFSKSSVWHEF